MTDSVGDICPVCNYRPGAIPGPSDAYAQANCPKAEEHAEGTPKLVFEGLPFNLPAGAKVEVHFPPMPESELFDILRRQLGEANNVIASLTRSLAEVEADSYEKMGNIEKTMHFWHGEAEKHRRETISVQHRAEAAEAELANIKNKLACATCLNRGTRKHPCPHKNECGYSTGEGLGQKDNNFWQSAAEFAEDCEEACDE
jgi:hypothetical protein